MNYYSDDEIDDAKLLYHTFHWIVILIGVGVLIWLW